jgi:hypothetical protein
LLRSQVALKLVPLLSEEMLSLSRRALSTMTISVTPPALPMAEPLASEAVKLIVPKSVSGRIPPENVQHGASTMTSAEERGAPDRLCGECRAGRQGHHGQDDAPSS